MCPYYDPKYYLCEISKTYQNGRDTQCLSSDDWRRCPNLEGKSCYLTTACVHHAGLADDCKELTTMRKLRDGYLLSLPNGKAMRDEYYLLAPKIVKAIECSDTRNDTLTDILTRVRQCVQFADNGNNEAAFVVYTTMFNELKNKYVLV